MTDPLPVSGTRAERTRQAILEVAESLFAEHGFARTRLEDVAQRVGIKRPSIVYHFRDKRELYDAVLGRVVGGLRERLRTALASSGTLGEQIEAAVVAWVDYVAERPSLARLLLREVAEAPSGESSIFMQHAGPVFTFIAEAIRKGQEQGLFLPIDPVHFASTITGATVFFAFGTKLLGASWPHDPFSPEQLAAHREEVRRITRRLLGVGGPRRVGRRRRPGRD